MSQPASTSRTTSNWETSSGRILSRQACITQLFELLVSARRGIVIFHLHRWIAPCQPGDATVLVHPEQHPPALEIREGDELLGKGAVVDLVTFELDAGVLAVSHQYAKLDLRHHVTSKSESVLVAPALENQREFDHRPREIERGHIMRPPVKFREAVGVYHRLQLLLSCLWTVGVFSCLGDALSRDAPERNDHIRHLTESRLRLQPSNAGVSRLLQTELRRLK